MTEIDSNGIGHIDLPIEVVKYARKGAEYARKVAGDLPRSASHFDICNKAYEYVTGITPPESLAEFLAAIAERQAFSYLVNEPDTEEDTPENRYFVSVVKTIAIARTLGEIGTSEYEEGGAWLSMVKPTPGREHDQSYQGSAKVLQFHQEMLPRGNTVREWLNRYVMLDTVQNTNPESPTWVSSIAPALESLPEDVREQLRRPVFHMRPYDSMKATATDAITEVKTREPILHPDGLVVCDFDAIDPLMEDLVTIDPDAQKALDAFEQAVNDIRVEVMLKPGQTVVVDNQVAFHGRGVIPPGAERFLLRAHVL